MLVTDWAEIKSLHNTHHAAATPEDAVRISMQRTSIDMSMVPTDTSFCTYLIDLVQNGTVSRPLRGVRGVCVCGGRRMAVWHAKARDMLPRRQRGRVRRPGVVAESRLDESVLRVLQLKEDLGLLDNPLPDPNSPWLPTIGSREDRDVALELARESIVLLKNQGNLLPLSATSLQRIFLVGPISDSLEYLCGGWSIGWQGPRGPQRRPTAVRV